VRSEDADETETDAEGVEGADAGELDPEDFDPEELTRTADGELIHEETGLIVEEEQIDPGPEWRAFNHGAPVEIARRRPDDEDDARQRADDDDRLEG